MSDVAFTLYKGFLIAEYSESDVRAYRSREYYAGNTTSYETKSRADMEWVIDDAGDHGDFNEAEYYALMRDLGRTGINVSKLEAPEQVIHQWGAEFNTIIEAAHAASRLERNLYEQGHTTPLEFVKAKVGIWTRAQYDIESKG